jgi:chromosome segregation ATPase
MCNKGENSKPIISGLEQKRNQWKKVIEQAKLAIPEVKNNLDKKGNQAEEQEESLFEYLSILEDDLILEDAVQTLNAGQSGKNGQNISITPQEVEEVQTYFENLHNFSLWFISIKNNSEEINKKIQEVDEELKKVIEKLNPLEEEYKEHIKKNQALAFGKESKKAKEELEETKAKLENEKKELEEKLQTSSSTLSKSSIEDVKNVIQKSDSILSKFFSIGEVSPQSITPIIINLSNEIHKHGG